MKKKKNIIQKMPDNKIRVFYCNNLAKGNYFIIDNCFEWIFDKYVATGDVRKNGDIDPCITINGEKIRLYNFILGTDSSKGEEGDHIDGNTANLCLANLRRGTRLQNLLNRKQGLGQIKKNRDDKYIIILPKGLDAAINKISFESKSEAEEYLHKYFSENDDFKEWTYEYSQMISKQNEIFEFIQDPYVDAWASSGTMGEILNLSPDNKINADLRNMIADVKGNNVPPDVEWQNQIRLMHDYHKRFETNKPI